MSLFNLPVVCAAPKNQTDKEIVAFAIAPPFSYVPHLGEIPTPTRQPPVDNWVAIVRFGTALIDKGTEADKAP